MKLVDTLDLGSSASRCVGSSPITRTKSSNASLGFFCGHRTRSLSRFLSGRTITRTKSSNASLGFFCGHRTRSLSRFLSGRTITRTKSSNASLDFFRCLKCSLPSFFRVQDPFFCEVGSVLFQRFSQICLTKVQFL